MIKKIVVSAAGQGTRMLELTKNKSKHLIEVSQRPFLAYLLDNVLRAGYTEIIIVAGFREDMIREFLKKYNGKNYSIKLVNQFDILGSKEKEYGTACPLKCVKDFIKNENFISVVGDNFYSADDLRLMNIDDNYNYVGVVKSDNPEKFGVIIEKDGFLEKIVEKPKKFAGNLVNTSLYKFTPEIFNKVSEIKKSPRGEYEITDAVSLLAKEKKVKVKKLSGFWMDFSNPQDIEKFGEFLEKSK